ncbi:Hvo_1808 family surface protein [Halolamina salifodinae]|uniref:PGF-CTERM protein n=1 Tax=Halolamina salifodinae TaxID=1202767 RepID=A0A8T4H2Y7_9EURY|nr:Hvo_1808 family surface protein [Halolamina salifodinae]MBP1988174.1 PGF-CTERM protein [Halolamina salifodinae]
MRRASAVFLTVVVVLAGLTPVAAAAPGDAAVDPAPVEATTAQTADNESAPADPESDRLGWENGYWHNESIDIDQSDGLTEAELNATVSRATARVEVIRGLEFDMAPPVEIVSREEFASSGNRSSSEAFRTFDDTKFEALFMIGESEDSLEVQDENRGATVGGYYSPAADSIVLVADNQSELQVDELTLGHELVHAIQDQEFNLTAYTSETRDGANANSGLIEGDANYVQHRYEQRCGEGGSWNGTCLSPESGDGGGGPPNMGVYFLNYQPYSDGPSFIAATYRQGGWAAVNDLYDAPPESAEQVIHPDRYGTDPPTAVELSDQHGEGWERVRPENRLAHAEVGQSGVAAMFAYPLYADRPGVQGYARNVVGPNTWLNYTDSQQLSQLDPLNYGFDAAAGWDGDRMHFYQNTAGETGYVWRLVWDSPEDATAFRDAYAELLAYWGAEQVGEQTYHIPESSGSSFADAFHATVNGDTVTIVNAPTTDSLSEIRSSADPQVATPTATPDPTATPAATSPDETADPATSTTNSPGFSAVTALVAVLAAALLAGRRR